MVLSLGLLWLNQIKALGLAGADYVGAGEVSQVVKVIRRQDRPLGQRQGEVRGSENIIGRIRSSAGAAENKLPIHNCALLIFGGAGKVMMALAGNELFLNAET
jgi:hypothetical protein